MAPLTAAPSGNSHLKHISIKQEKRHQQDLGLMAPAAAGQWRPVRFQRCFITSLFTTATVADTYPSSKLYNGNSGVDVGGFHHHSSLAIRSGSSTTNNPSTTTPTSASTLSTPPLHLDQNTMEVLRAEVFIRQQFLRHRYLDEISRQQCRTEMDSSLCDGREASFVSHSTSSVNTGSNSTPLT